MDGKKIALFFTNMNFHLNPSNPFFVRVSSVMLWYFLAKIGMSLMSLYGHKSSQGLDVHKFDRGMDGQKSPQGLEVTKSAQGLNVQKSAQRVDVQKYSQGLHFQKSP